MTSKPCYSAVLSYSVRQQLYTYVCECVRARVRAYVCVCVCVCVYAVAQLVEALRYKSEGRKGPDGVIFSLT